MQRLITQPVRMTVSGRRAPAHLPTTVRRQTNARANQQEPTMLRAASIALGVILAFALLGLLGAIDNVVSASADGSHHPVSQRMTLTLDR